MKGHYKWLVPTVRSIDHARPWRMIVAAAAFHLLVTTVVFLVGHFALMPSQFNEVGIAAFASDGNYYRSEINSLSEVLASGRIVTWLTAPAEFHCKLYSLPSAAFRPLTEFNVMTIEPLNSLYYVLILVIVFKLAAPTFGRRVGFLSAAVVAVWPTFLLHTTQLLRDPLVIVALLSLWLVICLLLTGVFNWPRGVALGALAGLSVATVWTVRLSMWDVVRATACLAIALTVFRQLRERRFLLGSTISVVLLGAAVISTPYLSRQLTRTVSNLTGIQERRPTWKGQPVEGLKADEVQRLPVWQRLSARRQGFIHTNEEGLTPGSNIDVDVRLNGFTDVILFLPRAAVVGLFAPFPNTWLSPGLQVGRAGRRLAGVETALTYGIGLLALIGLWKNRHSLVVWFMFLIFALGALSLGLVVVNIGTLYRFRYPFWILLVVLGAAGAKQIPKWEQGSSSLLR